MIRNLRCTFVTVASYAGHTRRKKLKPARQTIFDLIEIPPKTTNIQTQEHR